MAHVDDTGPPRVIELQAGAHILTVFDLDAEARPKVAALRDAFEAALEAAQDAASLSARMRQVLGGHETPSGDPLDAPCIHGDVYGTVSSSSIVVGDRGLDYRHADGRPCVTPFGRVRSPSESAGRSPAPG